jgi:peptidoglycan/xylan/chitin deacetylase (PgdA/CDA1 family)
MQDPKKRKAEVNYIKRMLYQYGIPLIGYPWRRKCELPIVYYHDVTADGLGGGTSRTDCSKFKKQMEYLKNRDFRTFTFHDLPKDFVRTETRQVLIAFDDGFRSCFDVVYPIMSLLKMKFNIFIATKNVEAGKNDYMNWSQIKVLHDSGIVGIGAHTHTHIDARKISEESYFLEIEYSNLLLKNCIGNEIDDFCFPYGYYDDEIVELLDRKKTYKRLYTSDSRPPQKRNHCLVKGRIAVSNEDRWITLIGKASGCYNIMALRGR